MRKLNRDAVLLVAGLVVVLGLITATFTYPLYRVGQHFERHFAWDPPVIEIGRGEDLKPQDVERLMKDPRQREILENLRSLPSEVPISPIWLGPKTGPGRNWIGYLAMFSTIAYGIWVVGLFRH